MDSTMQALISRCAHDEYSEADEASQTLDQANNALYEIALNEGPGGITDAYERAAWRKGADIKQTDAIISRANSARRQAAINV
jgi:hypothetical protein